MLEDQPYPESDFKRRTELFKAALPEELMPVPIAQLGFSIDDIARMSERGILYTSSDRLTNGSLEEDGIRLSLSIIPGSLAEKLQEKVQLGEYDEEDVAVFNRFIQDSRQLDDEEFRNSWIELF